MGGNGVGKTTLIEMLVVLVIIGLIMGLVGPRVLNYLTDARIKAARLQIEALQERGWVLRLLGEMEAYVHDQKEEAQLAEQLGDVPVLAYLHFRQAYTHRWFCRYAQARQAAEDGPELRWALLQELAVEVVAEDPDIVDFLPDHSAGLFRGAAGAVVFGKTNVPRWSGDYQTYNEMFGTTNNPWDLDRTPGGSSGGRAGTVVEGPARPLHRIINP